MAAGPADKALDVFKALVFDPLVKVVIAQTIGLAGFLAWGPIAFLITRVITFVAEKIYAQLGQTINFQYVLLLNDAHHKAYVSANSDLRDIAKSKGINSPEYREAREIRKAALAKFVRYSGT